MIGISMLSFTFNVFWIAALAGYNSMQWRNLSSFWVCQRMSLKYSRTFDIYINILSYIALTLRHYNACFLTGWPSRLHQHTSISVYDSTLSCDFHRCSSVLLRLATAVSLHCGSVFCSSSTIRCMSRMARSRRWYFRHMGSTERWWQWRARKKHSVGNLGDRDRAEAETRMLQWGIHVQRSHYGTLHQAKHKPKDTKL